MAPALAVGVFNGNRLQRTVLEGKIDDAGTPPQADTAFRIASCTKSFTAAAILILRDRGLLELDDEVVTYLPHLRLLAPSADIPYGPLTLRMLLSMSGGMPTDDPWADRQEAMPDAAFEELLAAGIRLVRKPGTGYEYSNLGYAMLGAVIAKVTGTAYIEVVRKELLEPLGLLSTGFDSRVPANGGVAKGYSRRGDSWELQPFTGPGAFSAIGGLFSTVNDLGRWATWFADAFNDGPEEPASPLSRASRREMQRLHVLVDPESPATAMAGSSAGGYGLGLRILNDPERGLIVGHSGGYPGFSSHMTWHPASGYAVVGFENATYANVGVLVREVLGAELDGQSDNSASAAAMASSREIAAFPSAVQPALPSSGPWPETLAARAVVERLIREWDDPLARSIFAANVELDEAIVSRRDQLQSALAMVGTLDWGAVDRGRSVTAARHEWLLTGSAGTLRCELLLTPEAAPKVQTLKFTANIFAARDAAEPVRP
ncbi:serine hydrolase domain-containing protein [Pseudarthrobacter sp. J1763]|uniref:serine hydrolase domain-containing protein n=1 Tax=Pseudarthrobacter sp. J1763 TaxID=3420445 RepID=UPI003D27EAEE